MQESEGEHSGARMCCGPGRGGMRAAEEVCRQLRPAQSNRLATSHSELNFKITTPMGVWLSKVSRATMCVCLIPAPFNPW